MPMYTQKLNGGKHFPRPANRFYEYFVDGEGVELSQAPRGQRPY